MTILSQLRDTYPIGWKVFKKAGRRFIALHSYGGVNVYDEQWRNYGHYHDIETFRLLYDRTQCLDTYPDPTNFWRNREGDR